MSATRFRIDELREVPAKISRRSVETSMEKSLSISTALTG